MADESILVKLGLKMDDFQHGLEQAKKRVDSFSMSVSKIATLGFGTFGLDKIFEAIKGSFERVTALAKASREVGVSVETVQGFQRLTRTVFDAATAVDKLGKFNELIGGARMGDAGAVKLFKRLNIELQDSSGHLKTNDELLAEFLSKVGGIADMAERAKILSDVFKRGGEDIASIVNSADAFNKSLQNSLTLTEKEAESLSYVKRLYAGLSNNAALALDKTIARLGDNRTIQWLMALGMGDTKAWNDKNGWDADWDAERKSDKVKQKATLGLTEEEKESVKKRQEEIKKKMVEQMALKDKEEQSNRRLNDLIEKGRSLKEGTKAFEDAILDIDEEIVNNQKIKNDLAKEEKAIAEKRVALEEQLADAEERRTQAESDMASKQGDQLRGTVADWAQGGFNRNRWHNQQVMGARQIQWLEGRAKYIFQQTGNEDAASAMMDRAAQIRGSLTGLTANERAPYETMARSIDKAQKDVAKLTEKILKAKEQ